VWRRDLGGRILTFRIAGINNQNLLMRDEETGSYWQQVSGRAIAGPLRGSQLELVHSDELSFALWRQENPRGTVLRAVDEFAGRYEAKDWETQMKQQPTVVSTRGTPFEPRELILGVRVENAARAYPLRRVLDQMLIQDILGGKRLVLIVGPDGKSVRVFATPDVARDFYLLSPSLGPKLMMDSTGGHWNFEGCPVGGDAAGCLERIDAQRDYWFDWHLYHPDSTIFGK
jgi:hypothetical protein